MPGDKEEESKNDAGVLDHNSPYYIHASDYPRQMHVNDPLTDGNYIDWSQEMLNFLFAKNKVGFIDGSIKKPEQNSTNYMLWMRCDAMIKGWLNTAMEKEIRTSVKYATTAQEIWADLKERFGKDSAPRAYELKQSLTTTKQEGMSVSAYYTKLRVLWDEIQSVLHIPRCNCDGCTCGIGKKLTELKEKERLYEFLLGLDSDFGTIRTQILAMQPLPSLGTAYHLVADDEQQRAVSGVKRPTTDATAFQAFIPKNRDQKQPQSKFTRKDGKRNVGEQVEHCDFCGKDGHNKDGCFKRIGYPEWWPGKVKQEKTTPRAACVEGEASEIPELTAEQYQQLVKMFGAIRQESASAANMASNGDQEGLEFEDVDWSG
ncbi:putative retrotransposon Copia-like protein [Helianthus debilis subsp. tardiflorus]